MKKILLISDGLNRPAGTERATVRLANMLCELYEIQIVSPSGIESYYPLDPRVEVVDLKMGNVPIRSSAKILWLLRFYVRLVRLLRITRPNVLVGFVFYINCLLSLTFLGGRKIYCEHISYFYHGRLRRAIRSLLYRLGNSCVVVLTKIDEEIYLKQKISVRCIPNFVEKIASESDLPHRRSQGRILSVGRLAEQKGFDLLIEAFNGSNLAKAGWRLTIIGEGEMRDNLIRQISDNDLLDAVEIVPPTKNLLDLFEHFTFYVLSSRHEALPMVLLEAISNGLPVVAFDCVTGPRQILSFGNMKESYAGILVRDGDTDALAAAMAEMALNTDLQNSSARNGLLASRKYSIDSVRHSWQSVLEES